MKDIALFELMEKGGEKCLRTRLGAEGESVSGPEFQGGCPSSLAKRWGGLRALGVWQPVGDAPGPAHAYGHTWSPGYELPAGRLHGQAVGTCMGCNALSSYLNGFVSEVGMHRVLKLTGS